MRTPICSICERIHIPSTVVAIGRFDDGGPSGYRAPGGPVRSTRAEAELDLCIPDPNYMTAAKEAS